MEFRQERRIHLTMCVTGGLLGGYSLLLFSDTLSSALTTNLAVFVLEILKGNPLNMLIRLGVVALYCAGLALPNILEYRLRLSRHRFCLLAEAVLCIIAALMPSGWSPLIRAYPVFLSCSIQFNSFIGYGDMGCASVFSTNNMRQTINRLLNYKHTGDPEMKKTGLIFLSCLVFFHIGIVISFFTYILADKYSLLFAFVPLAVTWIMENKYSVRA